MERLNRSHAYRVPARRPRPWPARCAERDSGANPAAALVALACGVVALALASCGGGPGAAGIASLGSSSSTTLAQGGLGNSGALKPSAAELRTMTAFAACVRRHGAANFPDPPYTNQELNKMGFGKDSPQMLSATRACHAEALAAGVVQTPAALQQHLAAMLAIARCMRANGVPGFPDPNAKGALSEGVGAGAIASSPRYAAAAKKCGAPPGASPGGSRPATSPGG